MRDKQRTNKQTLKIELLSQWKLEAEFRNSDTWNWNLLCNLIRRTFWAEPVKKPPCICIFVCVLSVFVSFFVSGWMTLRHTAHARPNFKNWSQYINKADPIEGKSQ